jgi:hypothetical protein
VGDGVNWNTIAHEDYRTFQQTVKAVSQKENITPLQFDFLYWE